MRRVLSYLAVTALVTGLLALAPSPLLAAQSLTNLGGWWRFDENGGTTAADSSGNGNNGTLSTTPSPVWTSGKFGSALDFSGGGWVQVPNNASLESQAISAEAWVKATSPGNYKYILAKGSNQDVAASYGLYTGSTSDGNGIGFYVADCSTFVAAVAPDPSLWDGTWHRVTGTYDPAAGTDNVKVFVDGTEVASATGSVTVEYDLTSCGNGTQNDLSAGTYLGDTSSHGFPGVIDEPRVWAKTLADDGSDGAVNDTTPPVVSVAALDPIPVGQASVTLEASATDAYGVVGGEYSFNDGAFTPMTQSDSSLSAVISTSALTPGVYPITVDATDYAGNASDPSVTTTYLVVYDPSAGFVTGGGWIDSPTGAYTPDTSLAGKATFGFVSKYQKGATVPTGSTEFQFKVGNLNFHSDVQQWLVVNKASMNAQFKGTGTINGAGDYGFMIWATDGSPDTFRIQIWDQNNGDAVVYDNGVQQSLGGGSIVVHTK
jgi:hypothetical protein